MLDLNLYRTWIFDCDGVLLNSNKIKSDAFYETALPYGEEKAKEFITYHKKRGGISRFEKFHYFFEQILRFNDFAAELDHALSIYGQIVRKKLLHCPVITGLYSFLNLMHGHVRMMVISGGMETEIREVFHIRGLNHYFYDIYGSPDTKKDILQREIQNGGILVPAVFIGDSQYDHECADYFRMDFIFLSGQTEFEEWSSYFERHQNKNVLIAGNWKDITQVIIDGKGTNRVFSG